MKLVLAVLLVILLLLQVRLWSGAGSLADINRLEGEIQVQQADNALLVDRNEALRQEVNDLKNGLDSIEERARSQLGLVRKGETFILVVEKDDAEVASESGAAGTGLPASAAGQNPSAGVAASAVEAVRDGALESGLDTLPPPVASDERSEPPPVVDPAP